MQVSNPASPLKFVKEKVIRTFITIMLVFDLIIRIGINTENDVSTADKLASIICYAMVILAIIFVWKI